MTLDLKKIATVMGISDDFLRELAPRERYECDASGRPCFVHMNWRATCGVYTTAMYYRDVIAPMTARSIEQLERELGIKFENR